MTGRAARSRPDQARARSDQVRAQPDQAWPEAEIRAAGAVLYRRGEPGVEVAVIHRPRHDDWSFPKGKLEPGEHVLLAAVREVTEETGVRPVLGQPLAAVRYLVEGRPKRVDYWAGRAAEAGQSQAAFAPGDEVDRLDWLPVPAVSSRLTYRHDARLLERLLAPAADDCPPGPDTVPYVLLRHASAGRKSAWRGDDLLRPLDERGEADAAAVARLLACYGVQRVISSAAERCLGTVRPYAEQIGAPVEAEPAFTVRAGDGDGDRGDGDRGDGDRGDGDRGDGDRGDGDRGDAARRRVAELLARRVPTVICGHRENLPVLYAQARGALRCSPPDDGWSPPKAGFWVLHTAGDCLAAVEHHPPAS